MTSYDGSVPSSLHPKVKGCLKPHIFSYFLHFIFRFYFLFIFDLKLQLDDGDILTVPVVCSDGEKSLECFNSKASQSLVLLYLAEIGLQAFVVALRAIRDLRSGSWFHHLLLTYLHVFCSVS